MKIKINNKSHEIKPASELTIKEYILLFSSLDKEVNAFEMLIRYISVVTGIKYNNVADIDINDVTIRRLYAYIGEIILAKDMPESKSFYYKKSGKYLHQKQVNFRTIGVRKLLEDRKTDSQTEQVVYLLAIYLSEDYDIEKVEDIYNELQDYNAIDVLSFIVFFFKSLHHGKKSGKNFLKMLLKKVSTKIVKLSSK